MPPATAAQEWRRGWRVVAGAAIGSGLGIPLFYYTFSLFTLDLTREFGVTRGELANVQALIVAGALAAPLVGRLLDARGFGLVFGISTLIVAAAHLALITGVTELWQFAIIAFVYGAAGVGCGPLVYTRPITAWFSTNRGLALGVASLGTAVTAIIVPPIIETMIATEGWRSGFLLLAVLSVGIGLPAALLLVKNAPPEAAAAPVEMLAHGTRDRSHLKDRDFLLLAASLFLVAIPGAGLLSQLSPLVQEEGISAATAAYGVSAYAIGQLLGRVIAGWFLDRANPRLVALFFMGVPALGFILLGGTQLPAWATIVAIALIGVQQGAEIDLFAWFTARRFGVARYGQVYGWIIAASWIGNATGILTFGWLHDAAENYALAELIGAGLMMASAALIALVRLEPSDASKPHPDKNP